MVKAVHKEQPPQKCHLEEFMQDQEKAEGLYYTISSTIRAMSWNDKEAIKKLEDVQRLLEPSPISGKPKKCFCFKDGVCSGAVNSIHSLLSLNHSVYDSCEFAANQFAKSR